MNKKKQVSIIHRTDATLQKILQRISCKRLGQFIVSKPYYLNVFYLSPLLNNFAAPMT